MFRLLKYLLILVVLAAIGLWGYSYLMEPEITPRSDRIEIDAN
jgi:hypothetical protein